jgi:hypothetical protein
MTRSEGNRLWTEGPWRVAKQPDPWPKEDEWRIHYGDSGCWLATVHLGVDPDDDDIEEAKATANLIAAAPRLYETLDVLLNCLDREAVARLGIEQEVLAAVCALQQARGETND